MPRFMDQELFNSMVFTNAWAKRLDGGNQHARDQLIRELIVTYRKSYPADEFEAEVKEATQRLLDWLDEELNAEPDIEPGESQFWLNAFRIASKRWRPDGTRKPRRFFNGIWFTSLKKKPTNRVDQFGADLMLYFVNIHSGRIDLQEH